MALTPEDRFANFMASRRFKVTEHKARVLNTAVNRSGTFCHTDIAEALEGNVSRATVYWTLKLMVDAGILRRVIFNDREVLVVSVADGT